MKNKYSSKEQAVVVSCIAVYLIAMTLMILFVKGS